MRRSHIYVILIFIAMQLSSYLVPDILFVFDISKDKTPDTFVTAMIYYSVLSYAVALLLSIWILLRNRNDGYRSVLGEHDPYSLGKSVLLVIGGFFLAWFSNIIAGSIEALLFGVRTGSENTAKFIEIIELNPLFILIPVLFAPIYEEIVFRFILFRAFLRRMHWIFASILSSLIFGALHMEWEHLLIYSGIGLVLAWLYKRSKRIYVPIAVHMILNSITLIVQMNLDHIQSFIENNQP